MQEKSPVKCRTGRASSSKLLRDRTVRLPFDSMVGTLENGFMLLRGVPVGVVCARIFMVPTMDSKGKITDSNGKRTVRSWNNFECPSGPVFTGSFSCDNLHNNHIENPQPQIGNRTVCKGFLQSLCRHIWFSLLQCSHHTMASGHEWFNDIHELRFILAIHERKFSAYPEIFSINI